MSFINRIKSIGKSVTYYYCPKCERVYMVRTSHCDYSSAGDLENLLSAHKESDCRRNEEACGRCAENKRQGRPHEYNACDLHGDAVNNVGSENASLSSGVSQTDKAHSKAAKSECCSVKVDSFDSERGEYKRHACKSDNARPLGSSNFFRNHSIRLAHFIGLANSAGSEAA